MTYSEQLTCTEQLYPLCTVYSPIDNLSLSQPVLPALRTFYRQVALSKSIPCACDSPLSQPAVAA